MLRPNQLAADYEVVARIENLITLQTEICIRIWLTDLTGRRCFGGFLQYRNVRRIQKELEMISHETECPRFYNGHFWCRADYLRAIIEKDIFQNVAEWAGVPLPQLIPTFAEDYRWEAANSRLSRFLEARRRMGLIKTLGY